MTQLQTDIVAAARDLVNVPFHHQGRSYVGVDCAGVIYLAAKANGIHLEDVRGYGRQPSGHLVTELERQLVRVSILEIEPGDVLLIKFDEPQHLAMVSGVNPLKIIHAYGQVGKVVEHEADVNYIKRIIRAYRFKELIND